MFNIDSTLGDCALLVLNMTPIRVQSEADMSLNSHPIRNLLQNYGDYYVAK